MGKPIDFRPTDHLGRVTYGRKHREMGNVRVTGFIHPDDMDKFNVMQGVADRIMQSWRPKLQDVPVKVEVDGVWHSFKSCKEADAGLGWSSSMTNRLLRMGDPRVKRLEKTPPKGRVE